MATTRELVYALWRHLEGGSITDDSRFTYRELRIYIRSGIAEAIKASHYEQLSLNEFRYGEDSVTTLHRLKVIKGDGKYGNLPYVTLPVKTIALPANRGISVGDRNRVSAFSDRYVPVRLEEVFVATLQPPVPCVISFYRVGEDLVFFGGEVNAKELDVITKYAMPPENDDDADTGFPEEFTNRLISVAAQICNGEIRPTDTNNDGAPLQIR